MLFFLYGFLAAVLAGGAALVVSRSAGATTASAIVAFVILGFIGWAVMPVLAWNFGGIWMLAGMATFIGALIGTVARDALTPSAILIPGGLAVTGMALAFVTTSAMFHAGAYRNLLGTVTESRFTDDVSPVNINQIRIVDGALAHNIGQKRLGEIPGLGSRVQLGRMNIQMLNGCFTIREHDGSPQELCFTNELVWAGPLIHDGISRWMSHGTTPGYVLVSATNPAKVHMVTALVPSASTPANGRMGAASVSTDGALKLRYLYEGAYFGDALTRHVRTNGYLTAGLTDWTFELRDDGRPFWVITRYAKRIGFDGEDPTGVVIVDAQTGAIEEFDIASAPAWVDRIQPDDLVTEQLDNWGKYVRGWWNSLFAGLDVIQTTPGISLVYGADGRSYWYTGMQSAGADDATVGFVLVDTRTKQVRWYRMPGAKETSAQSAANNARGVREAGFQATFPVLYNLGGVPTYVMTLKGNDGLVKMYAFVSAQNLMITGVGSTLQDALRNYQNSLQQQGRGLVVDDLVKRQTLEAEVLAIARERRGDVEYYYFLLRGRDGVEFYAAPELSVELKWTKVGDRIAIIFDEGNVRSVLISGFDNLRLDLTPAN